MFSSHQTWVVSAGKSSEVNGASVSTVWQRDETKWQNTCTVEYLNGANYLLLWERKKKKNLNKFSVAFPHDCETSWSVGSVQEPEQDEDWVRGSL